MRGTLAGLAFALALISCTPAAKPSLVLGIGLAFSDDGKLIDAQVVGTAPSVDACRDIARQALAAHAAAPGVKLACATLEVQN